MVPVVCLGIAFGLALVACQPTRSNDGERHPRAASSATAGLAASASSAATPEASSAKTSAVMPPGDGARGATLIETFECNRCHTVASHAPAPRDKHCVQCHDDISRGRFPAPASAIARWQKTVDPYTVTPSLVEVGKRLRGDWLYDFLRSPEDLRPHLDASMPRLNLSPQDAADLVAYLTANAPPAGEAALGSKQRGRQVLEAKSCGGCHAFSGVPKLTAQPEISAPEEQRKRGVRLAPDLRFTRERFRRDAIVAWLREPGSLKADTSMPSHSLDAREAADLAAYLYEAELTPVPPEPVPERLPVLTRRVAFQEVMDQVFGVTCRHCHSDPDASLGDGGPGNTGGFGFAPKGLELATYRGVAAGYVDERKERQSVFAPLADGTPRLLAVLLARQQEEAGHGRSDVRGMPLGLPALSAEQVQLVESWIAQGRPR